MHKVHTYDKILSPIVTEKSTNLSEQNKIVFKVPNSSNKKIIKSSIEKIFKVNNQEANKIINKICTSNSIKKGIVMKSLRIAFFGCLSGPDLIQSWQLFSESKRDITLIERCII